MLTTSHYQDGNSGMFKKIITLKEVISRKSLFEYILASTLFIPLRLNILLQSCQNVRSEWSFQLRDLENN